MNQDQVKELLLSIEDAPMDFSLIFSGKKSKKVNGLYKPDTREIIIHNRNFPDDENLLLYTAIHEYAHHLHACSRGGKLSSRAHNSEFWAVFHGLLDKAEEKELYRNIFSLSPELTKLTERIKKKYLLENGNLVKEFGKELIKAEELCIAINARFDDYLDRVLCIPKSAARAAIKMHQYDLDPAVGQDNMKFLAGLSDDDARAAAERALLSGKSPDTVKAGVRKKPEEDARVMLEKEKARLEKTIAALSKRLDEVEQELKNN